ncbi:MAG: ROK family protein [Planctomycetia bacterium]|nr:ROK family protein [Planctomycetia bacterium]
MPDAPLLPLAKAKPPFHVGIDLGGTNVKIGAVDELGRVVHRDSFKTLKERGPEDCARRMGRAVLKVIRALGVKKNEVASVGLGSPGTMDVPKGLLLVPHNFLNDKTEWRNFPIRDRVSHHCGLAVTFANDANAAAYGEFWVGRGRKFQSMVLFTLGTGVGCGIVFTVEGQAYVVNGETSHGAECGHIIIDMNDSARMCGCGQRGHLESYASATGVIARAKDALADAGRTSVRRRVEAGETLTPLLLAEEAERKDAFALRMVLDTAMYMGIGIVNLLHTVDPDGVVLGGAMTFGGSKSPLGRKFLARVKEEVQRRAFPTPAAHVIIDYATLGNDAGFIGAAGMARLQAKARATAEL